MSADDFFSRWSRKAAERQAPPVQDQGDHAGVESENLLEEAGRPADVPDQRPVTLEDVAELTKDSDYSPFVAHGVDEAIKRSAMKKLFSDPHFNVMDGLDIYIDDYSVFEPLAPAVLALMEHAKPLLDPLASIQSSMVSLMQETNAEAGKATAENGKQDEADASSAHALVQHEMQQENEFDGSIEALTHEQEAGGPASHPDRTSEG